MEARDGPLKLVQERAPRGPTAFDVLALATASPSVETIRGCAYGPGARERLDVYRPRTAGPHPVAVFFYGGGWTSGDRRDYRFVGHTLAAQGVLTVIPDYRLYPEVRYPGFLEDCARAVGWCRDHVEAHGGDPHQLFLIGHSAGAYNAAMLAADGRWLDAAGLDPRRDLRGLVGLAGPYDFLPLRSDELRAVFGPGPAPPDTQPIHHVDGGEPPMLLLSGRRDGVVDPGNTARMAARVRAAGGRVRSALLPRLGHGLILGAVAWPLRALGPINRELMEFVRQDRGRPA